MSKIKEVLFTLLLGVGALYLGVACSRTNHAFHTLLNQHVQQSAIEKAPLEQSESVVKTDTVIITQMQFQPATLTIHKGDKVVWINQGIVEHDVSSDVKQIWTSGTIEIGKTFETVPDKSFKYICSIHPTMKGEVVVQD